MTEAREIVGLVPAAGQATRVAPLPCSKELYPLGFWETDDGPRPKAVCHYLLERMRLAGARKAYVVLRKGKWDIPAYLGDGAMLDMHLAYLIMRLPFGAPYTLDQAYPFVQHARVLLGFPDIIFQPQHAFEKLLARQSATGADVVLGLFPPDRPQKWDMVDLDEQGRVRQIVIKPPQTSLRYAWCIAVWTPVFTQFMHHFVLQQHQGGDGSERPELFVGDAVRAAMRDGLQVEAVPFPDGGCIDIGTPEALVRAVREHAGAGSGHS